MNLGPHGAIFLASLGALAACGGASRSSTPPGSTTPAARADDAPAPAPDAVRFQCHVDYGIGPDYQGTAYGATREDAEARQRALAGELRAKVERDGKAGAAGQYFALPCAQVAWKCHVTYGAGPDYEGDAYGATRDEAEERQRALAADLRAKLDRAGMAGAAGQYFALPCEPVE